MAIWTHNHIIDTKMIKGIDCLTMKNQPSVITTVCWALWPSTNPPGLSLSRSIDATLKGFQYYPEPEWSHYGYRPPETLPLMAAWRDSTGQVFVFLLCKDKGKTVDSPKLAYLYITGKKKFVDNAGLKINQLKESITRAEQQTLIASDAKQRLEVEKSYKLTTKFLGVISLITAVVNATSIGIRKFPIPEFASDNLRKIYMTLASILHITSLLALLVVAVLIIFYLIRYAFLIQRRF